MDIVASPTTTYPAVATPAPTVPVPAPGVPPLRGRGLRFVLVNELMNRPSMTVAEMTGALRRYGYRQGGRASKVISDALRWEVRRGRVLRLGRGLYRYHRAPRSTVRRIRLFAQRCRTWLVAVMRLGGTPPAPVARRLRRKSWADESAPPWVDLEWLWTA